MEKKIYLVSTVRAEFGFTHNHIANLYSAEDLKGTDYKKLPTRKGQTVTLFDIVEDYGQPQQWVTTITKIA